MVILPERCAIGWQDSRNSRYYVPTPKRVMHRKSNTYRQQVRRKFAAYERHIQIGLIAQGLLQYLALTFPRLTWAHFNTYIRTGNADLPSEWVVAHALRHTWLDFLRVSPAASILKKFLADKLDPYRAGICLNSGLDMAA